MSKLRWSPLNSNDHYMTVTRRDVLLGWVVKISGVWIARNPKGTISVPFDTLEEAKQFLTVMVSGDSNER